MYTRGGAMNAGGKGGAAGQGNRQRRDRRRRVHALSRPGWHFLPYRDPLLLVCFVFGEKTAPTLADICGISADTASADMVS